jgi:hypothetical protein
MNNRTFSGETEYSYVFSCETEHSNFFRAKLSIRTFSYETEFSNIFRRPGLRRFGQPEIGRSSVTVEADRGESDTQAF